MPVQRELVKVVLLPASRTVLTDEFPQHVVCEWLGNSERVAEQVYLKVTDAHLATACMVPTVQKVVSNVVPDMAVIEGHERSTDSQTLEKKS